MNIDYNIFDIFEPDYDYDLLLYNFFCTGLHSDSRTLWERSQGEECYFQHLLYLQFLSPPMLVQLRAQSRPTFMSILRIAIQKGLNDMTSNLYKLYTL